YGLIALAFANGLMTLMSGISGIYFLLGYMQNNDLSLVMAIGFIGVISTDFGIMHLLSRVPANVIRPGNDAMRILKDRYAKGEISKEEYDRMREELGVRWDRK
ncbi:MAG: SHOCT domain-containing protein, partial [Thermodesulfobium sp.]